jgi:dTMP kinase
VEVSEHLVFVVLDGLDASGKSTQALKLCNLLRKRGNSVCLRCHPSDDNFFGVETRKFLYSKGRSAHLAAAVFYALDVVYSILHYSWREYDYVIFVRYLMGTSYLPSPVFRIAYSFFASIVPTSELMFFLDVNPREAYRRIVQTRGRQEMFESLSELELIRRRALFLASKGKWTIIDANKPAPDIEKEILESLSR